MEKDKVIERINEMEAELATLKASLNKRKAPSEECLGVWVIPSGENHSIRQAVNAYSLGLWSPTREGVERIRDRMKAKAKLEQLADGYEFVDGEHNHCFGYTNGGWMSYSHMHARIESVTYFPTREAAEAALKAMGDDMEFLK